MTDLTYKHDGLFTRFFPLTKEGENVWREIAKLNGGVAVIFQHHEKAVLAQIRKAGYTVKRHKPVQMSSEDIEEIYKELDI